MSNIYQPSMNYYEWTVDVCQAPDFVAVRVSVFEKENDHNKTPGMQ